MRINRLNKIEKLLGEQESISINTLCEAFQVSKNTIRRDIAELEKRGFIKKTYGGIRLNHKEILESFEIKNQNEKSLSQNLQATWFPITM